jgi:hypothetical protein
MDSAKTRCSSEFAGRRVLRSVITLSRQRKAVGPFAPIEKPTISPLLLMLWQQGAMVARAPASVPMSLIPVALVHKKE